MICIIAVCVIIMSLGVVFHNDTAIMVGGMLGVLFSGFYYAIDETDQRAADVWKE